MAKVSFGDAVSVRCGYAVPARGGRSGPPGLRLAVWSLYQAFRLSGRALDGTGKEKVLQLAAAAVWLIVAVWLSMTYPYLEELCKTTGTFISGACRPGCLSRRRRHFEDG